MFYEELKKLMTFVETRHVLPNASDLLVCEVPIPITLDRFGRIEIERAKLILAKEYDQRFIQIQKRRPTWINLSLVGLYDGFIVISVELPSVLDQPAVRTSINYSGPTKKVLENGWDAQQVFSIY